jgi:uncharacterized membrane protein YsdA (DUF1294 family)
MPRRRKRMSAATIYGISCVVGVCLIMGSLRALFWMGPIISYVIAVNVVTIAAYGYDKAIAGQNWTRIPEKILHSLALLGGSPGALIAQRWFRHKTIKGSFRQVYWAIVVLQILALIGYLWWRTQEAEASVERPTTQPVLPVIRPRS